MSESLPTRSDRTIRVYFCPGGKVGAFPHAAPKLRGWWFQTWIDGERQSAYGGETEQVARDAANALHERERVHGDVV